MCFVYGEMCFVYGEMCFVYGEMCFVYGEMCFVYDEMCFAYGARLFNCGDSRIEHTLERSILCICLFLLEKARTNTTKSNYAYYKTEIPFFLSFFLLKDA